VGSEMCIRDSQTPNPKPQEEVSTFLNIFERIFQSTQNTKIIKKMHHSQNFQSLSEPNYFCGNPSLYVDYS
jgi:hypothetical protein